ncbi:MAG: hypothetical protein M5U16_14985 [Hyphomicrobium sp.]|nr:hypothetical protein [Hyphomicrobium sp.]
MKAAGSLLALLAAVALSACSGSSGLTTGALLGEDKPAAPVNDAPARAFRSAPSRPAPSNAASISTPEN